MINKSNKVFLLLLFFISLLLVNSADCQVFQKTKLYPGVKSFKNMEEGSSNYLISELDSIGRIVKEKRYANDKLKRVTVTQYNQYNDILYVIVTHPDKP